MVQFIHKISRVTTYIAHAIESASDHSLEVIHASYES